MKNKNLKFYLYAIFLGLIIAASAHFQFFTKSEKFFEDHLASRKPINQNIVIAAIDNESVAKIGPWPWPRKVFANALQNLKNYKPKAVALDLIFSEPSPLGSTDDQNFIDAMKSIKYPFVLPEKFSDIRIDNLQASVNASTTVIKSIKIFDEQRQTAPGHTNLIIDDSGVVRNVPLWVNYENSQIIVKALGLKNAEEAGLSPKSSYSKNNIVPIIFSGPAKSVTQVPFWKLATGQTDLPLSDKMIFIGITDPNLNSDTMTPFGWMSNVEIQAQIANMNIEDYHLKPIDEKYLLLWIFLAAIIPTFIFIQSEILWKAVEINILIGLLYNILLKHLLDSGYVVNFVHINLAWILGTLTASTYYYLKPKIELFTSQVPNDKID